MTPAATTMPTPTDPTTGPAPRAPWVAHFGFAKTPFTKRIAARDLMARDAHAEAVARIGFCIAEAAPGVVCGEVGAGKTVAVRAAVAQLDRTRYQVIYIPNPTIGTRGLYVAIVAALGGSPRCLCDDLPVVVAARA
jgi:type II secretory pathway predicted ATPase ExeA